MARRARRTSTAPPAKGRDDALETFLANTDRFTETISAQATAVAADDDQRLVIQSTAESFVAQTRKLTDFIRGSAVKLSVSQQQELAQFLSVQDGNAIIERSLRVSAQILSANRSSLRISFLSWLDEVVYTIKKIIMEILHLILREYPKWIDTILAIIDELLKLLKSLLGEVFGIRSSEVADEGSRGEINFLREITALAGLRAARTPRRLIDVDASD